MASWTLTHGVTTKDLGGDVNSGGWGFEVASRTLRSLAADTVELLLVPDYFADPTEPGAASWAYGDKVTILRDASPWFEGTLGEELRSASSGGQTIGWVVEGPWQALEEITYFQEYATTKSDGLDPPAAVVSAVERGDVTLMQAYNSGTGAVTILQTGQQIEALAEFGASRTAVSPTFQVGTIFAGINVDFIKARDETVANLIRKLAKWHPTAVARFDYTTVPPTLHMAEANGLDSPVELVAADAKSISIKPNPELQPPYVKISYKTTNTIDIEGQSQTYDNVIVDQYPLDISGVTNHRRAIRATVDLSGSDQHIQVQRVRTRKLPDSDDGSTHPDGTPGSGDAWKDQVRSFWSQDDRLPWLRDISPTGTIDSNIGVVKHTVEKAVDDDTDSFPVEDPENTYDLDETPRVLDKGSSTAEWMGVKSQRIKVTAKLIFQGSSRKGRSIKQNFTGTDPDTGYPMWEGSVVVTATSAVSKTYERTTSNREAEQPPAGIAQKLYTDLSTLRHTGTITFAYDDLPATNTFRPGQPLNLLTGGINADWTTMRSPIQEVTESVADGTVQIRIGAPDQLGINDFVTLARLWRANPPTYTTEEDRKTGKSRGSGKSTGGEDGPKNDLTPINVTPRDPLAVTVVKPDAGDFRIFVEPGWVTTSRALDSTTAVSPIMPEISGTALDEPTGAPYLTMGANSVRYLYAKHNFTAEGALDSVDILTGASVPTDPGGLAGSEYLQIAKLSSTAFTLPVLVEQDVEGSYFWPSKFEDPSPDTVNKSFFIFEEGTGASAGCEKLHFRNWTADFINPVAVPANDVTLDLAECGAGGSYVPPFSAVITNGATGTPDTPLKLEITPGHVFTPHVKDTNEGPKFWLYPFGPNLEGVSLTAGVTPSFSFNASTTNYVYLQITLTSYQTYIDSLYEVPTATGITGPPVAIQDGAHGAASQHDQIFYIQSGTLPNFKSATSGFPSSTLTVINIPWGMVTVDANLQSTTDTIWYRTGDFDYFPQTFIASSIDAETPQPYGTT